MDKRGGVPKDIGMHFPGAYLLTIGIFLLCLVYLYITLGRIDDVDRLAYQTLSESMDGSDAESSYTSRQQRQGLQKDLLYSDKGQRLQMRLKSDLAELSLDHHDGKVDIVENMHGVTCYIQEELFYSLPDGREAFKQVDGRLLIKHSKPDDSSAWISADASGVKPMQIIRFLEADTAFYYYRNDKFVAENVKVTRYITSGHTIEEAVKEQELIMSGLAAWVEFNVKEANFKAYQLKAKFYSPSRGL